MVHISLKASECQKGKANREFEASHKNDIK